MEGIRVVDLGNWVAGPAAAGVLADWGADVIKVEPPGGDVFRQYLRLMIGIPAAESPPFDLDNRGKRSVVLDLKAAPGRDFVERLLASADVFVTNWRLGALERLDLAPADVVARHPKVVACHVSGYGTSGDEAWRPAYDMAAWWARSGLAHAMAPEGGEILPMRGGMGDHTTALAAVGGIAAKLVERGRTGRGGLVETSLFRTGAYTVGWDLGLTLRFGKMAPNVRPDETPNPLFNLYRTTDGRGVWILGLESQRHWPPTARALGHPEWIDDERWADPRARRKNHRSLYDAMVAAFGSLSFDEAAAALDREGVWWAPLGTLEDLADDPQAIAAGLIVDGFDDANGEPVRAANTPIDFDGERTVPTGNVPVAGAHTAEVAAELGFTPAEIDALLPR